MKKMHHTEKGTKSRKVKSLLAKSKRLKMVVFAAAFALIGTLVILRINAAPGLCSTTGVVGTSTIGVTVPETAQYRLWVRMQVPDTTNTGNNNGVRVELAGSTNQCFTVTTTNANTVNSWQWVNSDALAASTPHITSQITTGNYTAKILGLKAGVKIDKVLFLKSDNTCTPSNDLSNGSPGDNCTTSAPTVSLTANPTSLTSGGSTTLNWSSTGATSCTVPTAVTGWSGQKNTSGSQVISNLTATTTFTLNCTNVGGTGSSTATVTVTAPPAPTLNISATPTTITSGSTGIISWSTTNATTCTASGGWSGQKGTTGHESTPVLTTNTTFTLTCTGPGGNVSRSTSITVTPPPAGDTTAPTIVTNLSGVVLTSGQTTVVIENQRGTTWTPLATDNDAIKTFVVTINDQPVTLTNGSVGVGVTLNGDYVLKAVATDNSNNVTTVSITVRVRHADFDRSGRVGLSDLSGLLSSWNGVSTNYDLDISGRVGLSDLSKLLNRWNSTQ